MEKSSIGGKPSCTVEVRRCEVETFTGMSKKTGRRETYHKLVVGCEALGGGQPVILEQFLPDGATKENTVLPFVKGDVATFALITLTQQKGVYCGSFAESEIQTPSPSRAKVAGKN